MDASSLIFLAIIAVWAAYLLGHWVRRRDQLATARSIDRFSESMRVLERRTPVKAVVGAPSRAFVVAPVRSAASRGQSDPTASTKTSRSAGPSSTGGATLTRGDTAPTPATTSRVTAPGRRIGTGSSERPDPAGSPPRPRSGGAAARGISAAAARRRARMLALLAAATAVSWLLVLLTGLAWWVAAVVTAALVAVLVQLRRTAAAAAVRSGSGRSRSAGRPTRSRRRGLRGPGTATTQADAAGPRPRRSHQDAGAVLAKVRASRSVAGEDTTTIPTAPAVAAGLTAPRRTIVDGVELGGVELGGGAADLDGTVHDERGTWRPVPVPPPTYTLKPKARSAMARIAVTTTDGGGGVTRADVSSQGRGHLAEPATGPAFDLDEILERRIASGN